MSTFVLLAPAELAERDRQEHVSNVRNYRPWTDAERDFLIETHSRLTAVEQAQQLGRDYDCLCYQRQKLRRDGLITPETRKYARPYTPEEDVQIAELAQRGYSIHRIARRLHRSYASMVSHVTMDLGGVRTLRGEETARVRNTTQVGELFSLHKGTINKWIRLGWLVAQRNGKTRSRPAIALITDEALMDFMARRDCWPAWSPGAITDPDWQAYARDLRSAGDWMNCSTIARQHGVRLSRIYAWFREGRVRGIQWMTYGREVLVWSGDVEVLIAQMQGYDWKPGSFLRRAARDANGYALPAHVERGAT